ELSAQQTQDGRDHNGGVADYFHQRLEQFEEPHVRKDYRANPAVTTAKKHVAIGPERIEEALVPACTLPCQRAQVGGDFGPAGRIGNEVDVVLLVLLQQVTVQPDDQVEILSDGMRAKPSDLPNQVGAKDAECSGDNRQCVVVRPRLPSNQERPQVF